MGYCCFQSSIVLINKLRRTRGSDEKVIEELKVNFTILGAMRKFYEPAHAWVSFIESFLNSTNVFDRTRSILCSSCISQMFTCTCKIQMQVFYLQGILLASRKSQSHLTFHSKLPDRASTYLRQVHRQTDWPIVTQRLCHLSNYPQGFPTMSN